MGFEKVSGIRGYVITVVLGAIAVITSVEQVMADDETNAQVIAATSQTELNNELAKKRDAQDQEKIRQKRAEIKAAKDVQKDFDQAAKSLSEAVKDLLAAKSYIRENEKLDKQRFKALIQAAERSLRITIRDINKAKEGSNPSIKADLDKKVALLQNVYNNLRYVYRSNFDEEAGEVNVTTSIIEGKKSVVEGTVRAKPNDLKADVSRLPEDIKYAFLAATKKNFPEFRMGRYNYRTEKTQIEKNIKSVALYLKELTGKPVLSQQAGLYIQIRFRSPVTLDSTKQAMLELHDQLKK